MRLGAAGLLVHDNQVLLARRSTNRSFYPGVWDLVGGHIEAGESPAQALVREVEEELGVRPTSVCEIAVVDEPRPEEYGEGRYHIFVVMGWDGEPRMLGDEHEEIRWVTLDAALALPLAHPAYCRLLEQVLVA